MTQHILHPTDIGYFVSLWRKQIYRAKVKAALFDMDGTLYDSMPRHAAAWDRLLTELEIPHTLEEIYLYEGMTGAATIDLLFRRHFGRSATPEECAKHYEAKTRYFNEQPAAPVMEGAGEALNFLASKGVEIILVTGSGQLSLIERLNADFPGIFKREKMVTSVDVTFGKPHPEPYLRGALLAGVSPIECIAIENAPLGVESASRSGAFTFGLTTGPIPDKTLAEAGANIVLHSMRDFAAEIPYFLQALDYNPLDDNR